MAKVRKINYNPSGTPRGIMMGEAFKKFDDAKRLKGCEEKTLNNYRKSFEYFMFQCDFDDATDIKRINKDLVNEWIRVMKERGIKAASINHYLRDCRAFFYWCMNDENKYIEKFTMPSVKAQEEKSKTYTEDDIKALLKKPEKQREIDFVEWRCWAIANLVYDMGARAGSILEIHIEDIDFKKRTIYLRHTKNKAVAVGNLSSACVKVLKEYMNIYRAGAEPTELLFVDIAGEPLTDSSLYHSFAKYCVNRGVKKTSLHGLRHTFATRLAENTNGDMVKVQKALGHSSIDMARKYVNIAAVSMGDYNEISPLAKATKNRRGRPKRKVNED